MEAIVFRSNLYPSLLQPESTTGQLQVNLQLEKTRKSSRGNQVLAVGDSRMGIFPRISDQLAPETGYALQNIGTPGTNPRCWYYMLREVDPDRNRYSAVLVPVNELEDDDWGDFSASEVDPALSNSFAESQRRLRFHTLVPVQEAALAGSADDFSEGSELQRRLPGHAGQLFRSQREPALDQCGTAQGAVSIRGSEGRT